MVFLKVGVLFAVLVGAQREQLLPNGQGCQDARALALAYCDASLRMEARIEDLAGRLAVTELADRLSSGKTARAIDRIGLPAQNYRVEAVHGLEAYCLYDDDGELRCPTYFPIGQGVAASFNRSVFLEMGVVLGREARLWTNKHGYGKGPKPMGPSIRSPVVNLLRDPRWGRADEAASECPYLTSEFGAGVVRGIQGEDEEGFLMATAEVKHFAAYSLEENAKGDEDGRKGFNAEISAFDWADSYVRPFQATIGEAKAWSYMCSYNAINGTPACASKFLSKTARNGMKLRGFIESDCDAVGDIWLKYNLTDSAAGASAIAMEAGTDLDCGDTYRDGLADAVDANLTSMTRLREAFANVMRPLFAAGLFETEPRHMDIDFSENEAHEAAAQSLVLLRNENNTLPFKRGLTVALIGPMALARAELLGPITIGPCSGSVVPSLLGGGYKEDYSCVANLNETLADYAHVITVPGLSSLTSMDDSHIEDAVEAARKADTIILAVGSSLDVVDEKTDLTSLRLPGLQELLISKIAALQKNTVVVTIMGNPMALDDWADTVPALLNAGIPSGPHAARVILDAVFGEEARFGRLPYTLYKAAYADEVPAADMSWARRSYRYYSGENVLFPFGFGLTYTRFQLLLLKAASKVVTSGDEVLRFKIQCSNVGDRAGDAVVQVYTRPLDDVRTGAPLPLRALIDFERLAIAANDTAQLEFEIPVGKLGLVDLSGDRALYPGHYEIVFDDGDPRSAPVTARVHVAVQDRIIDLKTHETRLL